MKKKELARMLIVVNLIAISATQTVYVDAGEINIQEEITDIESEIGSECDDTQEEEMKEGQEESEEQKELEGQETGDAEEDNSQASKDETKEVEEIEEAEVIEEAGKKEIVEEKEVEQPPLQEIEREVETVNLNPEKASDEGGVPVVAQDNGSESAYEQNI